LRPIVFVPLPPPRGTPIYAYVSAGARSLGMHISVGASVDPTPLGFANLPRGLMMLFGDESDAAAYEARNT
jgi:hypothetical protein